MRQRSLSRSLAPKPRRRDRRASPRRHHRSSHPSRSSRPWQARRCSSPCIHLLIAKLIAIAVTAHPVSISKSCHSCLATFVIGLLLDRVSSRWRRSSYYLHNLNIKGTTARTGSAPAARSHAGAPQHGRGGDPAPPAPGGAHPAPRAPPGPAPSHGAGPSSLLERGQSHSPAGLHVRARGTDSHPSSQRAPPARGRTGLRGRGVPSSTQALPQRGSGPAQLDGARPGTACAR